MAQENREPVSDQDFFSQYLQPTGTPATGDDPATPLPSNDDARDDGGDGLGHRDQGVGTECDDDCQKTLVARTTHPFNTRARQ